MTSYLDKIQKVSENEYATRATEQLIADIPGWIDTNSYTVNAILGGSIFRGIPMNKVTQIVGESTVGKTFLVLSCINSFLKMNDNHNAVIFDAESSITRDFMDSMSIDKERVEILPVLTVEDVTVQMNRILDMYIEDKKKYDEHIKKPKKGVVVEEPPKILFCLDSLGQLTTRKSLEDIKKDNNKKDMTKQQLLKKLFSTIHLKLSIANCPMIVTNHVYEVIGAYVSTKEASGGSGPKYNASQTILCSKRLIKKKDIKEVSDSDKKAKEVAGSFITVKVVKGRLTVEGITAHAFISNKRGLDKYFGLFELCQEFDLVVKDGNSYRYHNDTEKHSMKSWLLEPKKHFTQERLEEIDKYVIEKFQYGKALNDTFDEEILQDLEEEE